MSMMNINWRPGQKDLRDFGEASLVMMTVLALAAVLLGRIAPPTALWLCAAGLAVYLGSRLWAPLALPAYLALMAAAWPIGLAVSHVVLGAAFFLVFMPVGLVMRLVGRDPMRRRLRGRKSYWLPHRNPQSAKRYFNQF